ncbi:MAG: lipoprotein signal peptide [Verrucomicrobiaceae bacterium]|nr:lipoprotein signal peptide [Verrucomicrobiaceae bacterium]
MKYPRVLSGACAVFIVILISACSGKPDADTARKNKVGYTEINFTDTQRSRPLHVRLWYPAVATAPQQPVTYESIFKGYAAPAAEYFRDAQARPLIMLSHGDRGSSSNQVWLAEALAGEGFIVAAVDHWLNTHENNTPEGTLKLWERPADISFVVTQLLGDPTWSSRIDADRIGVAGHSAGGYTALALAGAQYTYELQAKYCESAQRGPDCELTKGVNLASINFSTGLKSYRDTRIKAVFAMAPAVGQGIEADSLTRINIPVYIVTAADDEILKPALNAARYARYIPNVQFNELSNGGHFAFLPDCTTTGKIVTTFMQFDICGNRNSGNRSAIHGTVNAAAIEFFTQSLRVPALSNQQNGSN